MQSTAKPVFPRILGTACALLACAALSALSSRVAGAADSSWMDIESRIQYGYYTEDVRALTDLAQHLGGAGGDTEPLRQYYAGLVNYRLALLLSSGNRAQASEATERCIDSLAPALKADHNFAAGLALQSACLRKMADLKPWAPLAGSRSAGQMERAVKLAPRDPRVLLLQALEQSESGKLDESALAKLHQAAAAFESERQGVDRTPGWGAAEAYAYLGRGYLERGEVLKARDALERALLIAPDFALAKRLMTHITSG